MNLSIALGLGARSVVGLQSTVAETYGALSRAQEGAGIATAATGITSGDPSGHWQVSGGRLYPSATGDTANMNAGPYLLFMDNGERFNITIEADTWDVATQAEWDFVSLQSTATLAGKKIALRNSTVLDLKITGGTGTALRRADYSSGGAPLVIEGRFGAVGDWDSYCTINRVQQLRGAQGITFRHLRTEQTNVTKFVLLGEASFPVNAIIIEDCDVCGQIGDPNGDYSNSANYPNRNIDMITTGASIAGSVGTITVRDCRVRWGANLINLKCDRSGGEAVVTGNECAFFYNDAVKISTADLSVNCPCTITDNYIHDPVGLPTDSDAQHPDGIQLTANRFKTADWTGILIEDNIILRGTSRGIMQPCLIDDMKTSAGDSGFFFVATVRNNLIVNDTAQAIWISQAKNCLVDNNTVVSWNAAASATPLILVGFGSMNSTSGGGNVVTDNIADNITYAAGTTDTNNFVTGLNGTTIAYTTLFEGTDFAPATRAAAVASFTPKAAANGAGAVFA